MFLPTGELIIQPIDVSWSALDPTSGTTLRNSINTASISAYINVLTLATTAKFYTHFGQCVTLKDRFSDPNKSDEIQPDSQDRERFDSIISKIRSAINLYLSIVVMPVMPSSSVAMFQVAKATTDKRVAHALVSKVDGVRTEARIFAYPIVNYTSDKNPDFEKLNHYYSHYLPLVCCAYDMVKRNIQPKRSTLAKLNEIYSSLKSDDLDRVKDIRDTWKNSPFCRGEKVECRVGGIYLTQKKMYFVQDVLPPATSEGDWWIEIMNDNKSKMSYPASCFKMASQVL